MTGSDDDETPVPASSDRLTVWTGWDRRKRDRPQPDGAEGAVIQSPAKGAHERNYELLAVAARGFRPPEFLRSHDLTESETAGLGDDQAPEIVPGSTDLRLTWSVLYRRIAATMPDATIKPYAIYLLGVNPPADTTDEDLEVFNDFYTNVHLVEVAEQRNALRAPERYELVDELRPPYQGAPRFLASYEVDEVGARNRRHQGPPYSTGPEIWQRHKTPWRLWYRLL